MEKANRRVICFVMIALSFTLIACSKKEEDFDATGYVKASLDAVFYEEYAEYAKFLDTSEMGVVLLETVSYLSGYKVEGDTVKITCMISLENSSDTDKKISVQGIFPEEVRTGLLENEDITGIFSSLH